MFFSRCCMFEFAWSQQAKLLFEVWLCEVLIHRWCSRLSRCVPVDTGNMYVSRLKRVSLKHSFLSSQVTQAGWCVWRTRPVPSPPSSATCRCRSSPPSSWPWMAWRSVPARRPALRPAPLRQRRPPSRRPKRTATSEGRQTWCNAQALVGNGPLRDGAKSRLAWMCAGHWWSKVTALTRRLFINQMSFLQKPRVQWCSLSLLLWGSSASS